MVTLTIMRGVSGSGKSTEAARIAAQTNAVVVSSDLIRLALAGDALADGVEANLRVWMERAFIQTCLENNRDVIVDDPNLDWVGVLKLANIGYRYDANVELKVLDVPLDVCLKNNEHRAMLGGRHVPPHSIIRQYEKFQETKNRKLNEILYQ